MRPRFGIDSTASVRILPYAATTPRSASSARSALGKSVVTQACRLQDWQAELFCELFDRSRLRTLATPARPIGLRDDSDNRMPRVVQGLKCGNGEFRSAEEDDSQGCGRRHHFPARAILRIFLHDQIALDAAHAIEKQLSVEMIHLVLKGAREQFSSLDRANRPVPIEPTHDRAHGPAQRSH